jgi:hypothetical protein
MKAQVLTVEGRLKYGLRKETLEPVFGQIKRCLDSIGSRCKERKRAITNGASSAPHALP